MRKTNYLTGNKEKLEKNKKKKEQAYLVRDIITMPGNHIKWRKILFCSKKLSTKLLYNNEI